MSTAVRDLERAREAFAKPTLSLLNQQHAPYVLAVFSALLPAEQTRMATDLFHVKVDATLNLLRAHDPNTPDLPAQDLCRRWVKSQWLWRTPTDTGGEEYRLTSHAQEALEYVNRLTGQRAVFGESRIRTILDAAQRAANAANPDPTEQIRRLEQQISDATAELERLRGGGEPVRASTDQVMDEYLNLASLLAALPSDFLRVGEVIKSLRRSLVEQLRAEQRSQGEVLADYLARNDELESGSFEGRAFRGAVDLLRDDRRLTELRADIDVLLDHEFAQALTPTERDALRQTTSLIRRGLDAVLSERHGLSASLARHIRRYDQLRDRELDDTLLALRGALRTWMATTGPRSSAPLDIPPARIDIAHLPTRFYDPVDHLPPAPLAQRDAPDAAEVLEAARRNGGPTLDALRTHLASTLDVLSDGDRLTAAEVFNALPEDLRRPVEIFGLLHAAAGAGLPLDVDVEQAETYRTRRPDGTPRHFTGRALPLTDSDIPAGPATTTGSTEPLEPSEVADPATKETRP